MSSRSSRSESDRSSPAFITVGRVTRPHGIRGEVVVKSLSDVERRLTAGEKLYVITAAGDRREVEVVSSRPAKGNLVVCFEGFATRDEAEALRGAQLEVERERVPPAPAGSYYFFELIDCECWDTAAGFLGRVVDVIDDGGGLLLQVEGEGERLLVPFVRAYLRLVDPASRRIELALPEGLVELCTSRF